jgi:transcriptional regulator with XRE-family HTH domain
LLELDSAVYQRIAEVRRALGITQKQFADSLKLSKTHIGAIETGTRRVNERIIKIVAMTYAVDETWLKTGEGAMFESFEGMRLKRIIDNFKKLDESFQEFVVKQVELVLEHQEKHKT